MTKKYLLNKVGKSAKLARLMAKMIDLFIVLILSIFFYPIGIILGGVYIGIADSLQNGQSVGKKFIGFGVISLEDKRPCTVKQSVIRNLPILIPLLFAIIPFWGWLLAVVVGASLMLLELYLIFTLDSGSRLGDVMADTTVMASDDGEFIKKTDLAKGQTI